MRITTRTEAYRFLLSLEAGEHAFKIEGMNKVYLAEVARKYRYEYDKKHGGTNTPFMVLSHASLGTHFVIIVENHERIRDMQFREYESRADVKTAISNIAPGGSESFVGDRKLVQFIRQECSRQEASFSVRKDPTGFGCTVTRLVTKRSVAADVIRQACDECLKSEQSTIVPLSANRISYIRSFVSNNYQGLSVIKEGPSILVQKNGPKKAERLKYIKRVYANDVEHTAEFRQRLKAELQAVLDHFDLLTGYTLRPGTKPAQ